MGPSACTILCFVLIIIQGQLGTAVGDCQDLLSGGTIQARLDESISKVTVLNAGLVNLSAEVLNIELGISTAAPSVAQLVSKELQTIADARIYLTFAANLALQNNRSSCMIGSEEEFQAIYDAANDKIAAAAQLYLAAFPPLADLVAAVKVDLSLVPLSNVLVRLDLCIALVTSRADLVDRCLAEAVYNYTQYISVLKVRIDTIATQLVFLKQGAQYILLTSSIDASVSVALFSVKSYVQTILTCVGVSVEILLSNAVTGVNVINVNYRLDTSAVDLISDITDRVNYLNQLKAYVNATVYSTTTLTAIDDMLLPLRVTGEVVVILSPLLAVNVSGYLQLGEAMVANATTQLYANLNIFLGIVDARIDLLLSLVNTYNGLTQAALANVTACVPTCIDARLNSIDQTQTCLHTALSNFEIASNVTKAQLAANVLEINAISSALPNDVEAQFGYIREWAISVSVELLLSLNLHVGNGISLEISNYLNTAFNNAVSANLSTIMELETVIANLITSTVNGLGQAITTSLQQILDAVSLILHVKPYYNVTSIIDIYNALYGSVLTDVTTYLTGIYNNVTALADVGVRFNLANNFTQLTLHLDLCIQSVTTQLTVNNFVAPFQCFVPILLNFNLLLNGTITNVQNTVTEISFIADNTDTLITGFVNTVSGLASSNATAIEQNVLTNATITTDVQVNATVANITQKVQNQTGQCLNQILATANSLLGGNFPCLVNTTAAVTLAVEPWELAVNFSILNYPNYTQQILTEVPLIQNLLNSTLTNITAAVAPYLNASTQEGLQLQSQLQTFVNELNLALLNYSAANLTVRCSNYTSEPYQLSDCLLTAYNELVVYISTVVEAHCNAILQNAINIFATINTNVSTTINTILNSTRTVAITEGSELITTYNVSTGQIISKTMAPFSSFNVTPILLCSKSIHNFAYIILQRMIENRNSGNYTISTTTYVIYDAVGSAMYVTNWYSDFPAERQLANTVVDAARQEVLALFPDATADADAITNVSLTINTTLYSQINELTQPRIDIACGQYYSSNDFYALRTCMQNLLSVFEVYYNKTIKECPAQNDWAYRLLVNDSAKFIGWRLNIVIPRAVNVVESLKPISEQLLVSNKCNVTNLIGFVLHIIGDRYNEYKPPIVSTAIQINNTAINITARDYTGIYSLEPTITDYLLPLCTVIDIISNSSDTSLLTADVLSAPQRFYNETSTKFQQYIANFIILAAVAVNATIDIANQVETSYAQLNFSYFVSFCYNASSSYPLIDLVVCYNQHHYGYLVYLSNLLRQEQTYLNQLTNINLNYVSLITNFAVNTLLPSYKNTVGLFAAKLYVAANITVPADLLPLLTVSKNCLAGTFSPTYQCFVYE